MDILDEREHRKRTFSGKITHWFTGISQPSDTNIDRLTRKNTWT